MPIKRELRWFYPIDWTQLSRWVRFERAKGACERCGRPHGEVVRCLRDGRWLDASRHLWRDGTGRPTSWPQPAEVTGLRKTRVHLATAHLDHDPGNNRLLNLRALCQRCHMLHDRPHHLARDGSPIGSVAPWVICSSGHTGPCCWSISPSAAKSDPGPQPMGSRCCYWQRQHDRRRQESSCSRSRGLTEGQSVYCLDGLAIITGCSQHWRRLQGSRPFVRYVVITSS
jgi:hypothetical protein